MKGEVRRGWEGRGERREGKVKMKESTARPLQIREGGLHLVWRQFLLSN